MTQKIPKSKIQKAYVHFNNVDQSLYQDFDIKVHCEI